MSEINRIKVVDFTMGRSDSEDVNTDVPFADNFEKTRTIQQANVVLGAYVNRNYKDMQNKADIDDIPTKVSELENDVGYITDGDIPSKTSDLTNDGEDGEHPFITKEVDDLTNYTDTETLNTDLGLINDDISDINTNLNGINSAIDLQLPNRIGDIVVDSIRSKNMFSGFMIGAYNTSTGVFETNNSVYATQKIPVTQGIKYCISGFDPYMFVRFFYWNGNTFVSTELFTTSTNPIIITTQGNYMAFQTSISSTFNNLQVEKGETKTPYRPYQNLGGMETYSTTETVIGTFLNKPLYRKVFNISSTSISSGSTTVIDIATMTNTNIINYKGYVHFTTSNVDYPINGFRTLDYGIRHFKSNNIVQLLVGTSLSAESSVSGVAIIEYTKTTD